MLPLLLLLAEGQMVVVLLAAMAVPVTLPGDSFQKNPRAAVKPSQMPESPVIKKPPMSPRDVGPLEVITTDDYTI